MGRRTQEVEDDERVQRVYHDEQNIPEDMEEYLEMERALRDE